MQVGNRFGRAFTWVGTEDLPEGQVQNAARTAAPASLAEAIVKIWMLLTGIVALAAVGTAQHKEMTYHSGTANSGNAETDA